MKKILCLMAAFAATSAWAGDVNLSNCTVQSMKTNSLNVVTAVVHGCEAMQAEDSVTVEVPQKSADGTTKLHSALTTAVAYGLRVDVDADSKGAKKPAMLDSVTVKSVPQR